MYVKPYLLLRLTCSRWTLNSLLQGGRMHQLDLALRGSQPPRPSHYPTNRPLHGSQHPPPPRPAPPPQPPAPPPPPTALTPHPHGPLHGSQHPPPRHPTPPRPAPPPQPPAPAPTAPHTTPSTAPSAAPKASFKIPAQKKFRGQIKK